MIPTNISTKLVKERENSKRLSLALVQHCKKIKGKNSRYFIHGYDGPSHIGRMNVDISVIYAKQ